MCQVFLLCFVLGIKLTIHSYKAGDYATDLNPWPYFKNWKILAPTEKGWNLMTVNICIIVRILCLCYSNQLTDQVTSPNVFLNQLPLNIKLSGLKILWYSVFHFGNSSTCSYFQLCLICKYYHIPYLLEPNYIHFAWEQSRAKVINLLWRTERLFKQSVNLDISLMPQIISCASSIIKFH